MSDLLIKCLSYSQAVRIYVANTKDIINEIGDRLNYFPSALAAMGRVLTVGAMIGSTLKGNESVTVKVEGNGPIGLIMVDANPKGEVRAYSQNPHCHFENPDTHKLDVRNTVGNRGFISVIKDLKLKEPFIGTVPIISGEIAEDFAYYFNISEQIPSAVSLGVLVDEDSRAIHAGGFMVQLLPNASEEVIDKLEEKIKQLPPMSKLLSQGNTIEQIAKLIGDETTTIIETLPLEFKCSCSKERFARGILSLGAEEIKQMIEEDKEARTICHFCGNEYYFPQNELNTILESASKKRK
ncbi:MAG: Hsp33 family molecular chaperone HslO [Bacilli bacterium]